MCKTCAIFLRFVNLNIIWTSYIFYIQFESLVSVFVTALHTVQLLLKRTSSSSPWGERSLYTCLALVTGGRRCRYGQGVCLLAARTGGRVPRGAHVTSLFQQLCADMFAIFQGLGRKSVSLRLNFVMPCQNWISYQTVFIKKSHAVQGLTDILSSIWQQIRFR